MNIPTIKATDAPSLDDLAKHFAIAVVALHPAELSPIEIGWFGRVDDDLARSSFGGLLVVDDPFSYQGTTVATSDKRIGRHHKIMIPNGGAVPRVYLRPVAVYTLEAWTIKQLEALRNALVPAWEGRKTMRDHGGSIQIASTMPQPRP